MLQKSLCVKNLCCFIMSRCFQWGYRVNQPTLYLYTVYTVVVVFCAIVPATETCHVKKAVRKKNHSEEIKQYEWIIDLPHTAAVLKELHLYIALAAVSLWAAPSRVWQQCLRIAPKTLACPALSDVTPGCFFRGKVERGKWGIRRVWLSLGAARRGEEATDSLEGRDPHTCS